MDFGLACGDGLERIVRRSFRPTGICRREQIGPGRDYCLVKGVLERAGLVGRPEHPRVIGLVLGEQQGRGAAAMQVIGPEPHMLRLDGVWRAGRPQQRPFRDGVLPPRPDIAERQLRQDVEDRRLRSAIDRGDQDQDVVGIGFGELDGHVKIAVVGEHAGVDEFEFGLGA